MGGLTGGLRDKRVHNTLLICVVGCWRFFCDGVLDIVGHYEKDLERWVRHLRRQELCPPGRVLAGLGESRRVFPEPPQQVWIDPNLAACGVRLL